MCNLYVAVKKTRKRCVQAIFIAFWLCIITLLDGLLRRKSLDFLACSTKIHNQSSLNANP